MARLHNASQVGHIAMAYHGTMIAATALGRLADVNDTYKCFHQDSVEMSLNLLADLNRELEVGIDVVVHELAGAPEQGLRD
jgi:hypothetical protein